MLSPTSERVPPDWHSLGRVVAWLDQFERKGGMNITVPNGWGRQRLEGRLVVIQPRRFTSCTFYVYAIRSTAKQCLGITIKSLIPCYLIPVSAGFKLFFSISFALPLPLRDWVQWLSQLLASWPPFS